MRSLGIPSILHPPKKNVGKQMKYADKNNIPFVIIAGEEELEKSVYTLKDMKSGEQSTLGKEALFNTLK